MKNLTYLPINEVDSPVDKLNQPTVIMVGHKEEGHLWNLHKCLIALGKLTNYINKYSDTKIRIEHDNL
jgi:hypothetical protein